VPHPTTLMKLTSRCGETAVAGLNEALLAQAAGAKLLRVARVRTDTTVICANVAYPTDTGLLAQAVGKLVRTARRVQAAGGATGTVVTDRRRAAARRVREIAVRLRTRGKLSREESSAVIARVTGELADLAEKAAAEAAAVLRNGLRALPRALSGQVRGRLRRALDELAVTLSRTAAVVAQTRTRLSGQMPQNATRLVSLHDPDARPIRKGRTDRPVEFGYKTQVTDNDDGIVLDRSVEYGAAPDGGPQLAPPSGGSPAGPAGCPARLPPTAATARPLPQPPAKNRARPRFPPAGQMANRMRRTDQLPQTRIRLGPHPPRRQERSRDLVRTRDIHPQPGQDQRPGRLTRPPTKRSTMPHRRLSCSTVPGQGIQ
jgi:IS5 family transposase